LGKPGLVGGARSTPDDAPRLVGASGGEKEGDIPPHVQKPHGKRDLVTTDTWKSPPVPARKDVLERCLDARTEIEPSGETLRDLAHRRERVARARAAGVRDDVLDHRVPNLRRAAGTDVGPIEREHLRRVARVDEEERGSVLDVLAEQLCRLVPFRVAPGGMQERDVIRVRELLRRRSGQLAETHREHSGTQRVLERLPGTEGRREREGADPLGGADRRLDRERLCASCLGLAYRHRSILCGPRKPWKSGTRGDRLRNVPRRMFMLLALVLAASGASIAAAAHSTNFRDDFTSF